MSDVVKKLLWLLRLMVLTSAPVAS